jgi:hypothetical protein
MSVFRSCHLLPWLLILGLTLPASALTQPNPSQVQTNRDIHVQLGQKMSDLACFNCSIYVRGQVAGDVFALHGNVIVETGGVVAGDVSTVWGDIRVQDGAAIAGDAAAIAGEVRRQPGASISGDVASMGGKGWLLLVILVSLLVPGLIVVLIIWLVHRSRRAAVVTAQASTRS